MERHHTAHTLWLTASPWEVRRRHTTVATTTTTAAKDGDRSPRLTWLARNPSSNNDNSREQYDIKRPVLFPSLHYLQWWQHGSDVYDVKWTTVRAQWWRTVYWSGSLCLCEWFDIHATFTPPWWEGKLLFLAHSLVAVCVYSCALTHMHTLLLVCSGAVHM